jgi:hypothetical protein
MDLRPLVNLIKQENFGHFVLAASTFSSGNEHVDFNFSIFDSQYNPILHISCTSVEDCFAAYSDWKNNRTPRGFVRVELYDPARHELAMPYSVVPGDRVVVIGTNSKKLIVEPVVE